MAAHWFDLPKFYSECERIARPGCFLALVSYGVPTMAGDIGKRLSEFYWQDIYEFWPEGRKHVETGYETLAFPFEERGLSGMAIEREWSLPDMLGYIDTWSAIRRAKTANADGTIERIQSELTVLWQRQKRHRVSWPITARIATIK